MQEEYGSKPENVKVALGPCIGPCCLEFDAKDAGLFTSINESCVIWKEGNSKPFVDLHNLFELRINVTFVRFYYNMKINRQYTT
jgi:copper oxidase (laccase) domain-containing protein